MSSSGLEIEGRLRPDCISGHASGDEISVLASKCCTPGEYKVCWTLRQLRSRTTPWIR